MISCPFCEQAISPTYDAELKAKRAKQKSDRIKAAHAANRAAGKQVANKRTVDRSKVEELFIAGYSFREIARQLDCSSFATWKIIKDLRDSLASGLLTKR